MDCNSNPPLRRREISAGYICGTSHKVSDTLEINLGNYLNANYDCPNLFPCNTYVNNHPKYLSDSRGYDRSEEGRTSYVFNSPDLTSKRDDVGGVIDELERGRPVQPIDDLGERSVVVDLHK